MKLHHIKLKTIIVPPKLNSIIPAENNKAEKGVGRVEQGCWACSFESGGQGGLAENVTLEQSHEQNA